jgi:hypothetical protein
LELPRDTALYIEWIDMDIETPKKDKCQGDYLRIKVSNFTKFYCGQLDGPKLLKLGPFDGTFTRKVKISFRSDNDGERGRGVKLYFYTNIQSSMFIIDQYIGSTETKYIKPNTKTQNNLVIS